MHQAIQIRRDQKRGCGWRKPGGLYLVADGIGLPCGKLPIPLDVCPCCGTGIKPTRGWTWVNGTALAATKPCRAEGTKQCAVCPLSKPMGRVGLLWVGGAFYKTPEDWTREANTQGVSRRISALPKEFKLGETWVWVAHREAIKNPDDTFTPAVFHAFKPQRVEYVVKGDESDEDIERMVKRGITPISVEKTSEKPLLAD